MTRGKWKARDKVISRNPVKPVWRRSETIDRLLLHFSIITLKFYFFGGEGGRERDLGTVDSICLRENNLLNKNFKIRFDVNFRPSHFKLWKPTFELWTGILNYETHHSIRISSLLLSTSLYRVYKSALLLSQQKREVHVGAGARACVCVCVGQGECILDELQCGAVSTLRFLGSRTSC